MRFYLLDVFAEEKYAGNQLAVVRDAAALTSTQMQKIAHEMNFSETSFILSDEERNGGYDARIFTPKEEVPFAGHPTLGTAYIIQREIVAKPVESVVLNLEVGQIPVTFNYRANQADVLWMKQKEPTFGNTVDPGRMANILTISREEIDFRFPIQEVSTGLPCMIVPLTSLAATKRCKIVDERYFDLIKDTVAKTILVFCLQTEKRANNLHARFFANYYGIPEDPATGSANGCLAGYLVRYRCFGRHEVKDILVEQGYEIDRPSLLHLTAQEKEGKIEVSVGGKVLTVAAGVFV